MSLKIKQMKLLQKIPRSPLKLEAESPKMPKTVSHKKYKVQVFSETKF